MHSLFVFVLWLARCLGLGAARTNIVAHITPSSRNAPKPAWVRDEIIRLQSLLPEVGCRSIETIFNRRFAHEGISIGKTYVALVLARHRYVTQVQSREAKRRPPKVWPHNARWGFDLTEMRSVEGRRYWIVGIIEYRSRALLMLVALLRKTAAALITILTEAFGRFGPPRTIVTDNEGMFRSGVWKRLLARCGVHHRRIQPYCPWQNGRIERFFGTLKPKLKQRRVHSLAALQRDLDVFRYWYNRIRPHQALGVSALCGTRAIRLNLTPAEAWYRSGGRGDAGWFEGWGGLLRGYAYRI